MSSRGNRSRYLELDEYKRRMALARFRLTQAIATAQVRYAAGDVVTDTLPLPAPADRHWPGLSSATMGPGMIPLDGAATAMKSASQFANEQIALTIQGVHSVG